MGFMGRRVLILATALVAAMSFVAVEGIVFCGVTDTQLMECLPAVAPAPPAPPPPTAACCEVLKEADLPCFCRFANLPGLLPHGVDPIRAKQLPSLCGLSDVTCT